MTLIEIYQSLRKNSKGKVADYRSDWRVDRIVLRQLANDFTNKTNSSMEFIHLSRDCGTWLYPVYRDRLDIDRPYLFGRCTPRRTLNDLAAMLAPNSMTVAPDVIFQHFDGKKVRVIDKAKARTIMLDAANVRKPTIRSAA